MSDREERNWADRAFHRQQSGYEYAGKKKNESSSGRRYEGMKKKKSGYGPKKGKYNKAPEENQDTSGADVAEKDTAASVEAKASKGGGGMQHSAEHEAQQKELNEKIEKALKENLNVDGKDLPQEEIDKLLLDQDGKFGQGSKAAEAAFKAYEEATNDLKDDEEGKAKKSIAAKALSKKLSENATNPKMKNAYGRKPAEEAAPVDAKAGTGAKPAEPAKAADATAPDAAAEPPREETAMEERARVLDAHKNRAGSAKPGENGSERKG